MKFHVIWVGSTSDVEFRSSIERYLGRIQHFFPTEIVEIAAEKQRQKKKEGMIRRAESARLIEAIPIRGETVILDERGKLLDSLKFSKWLEARTMSNPWGVNFVLGGDIGLDEQVRDRGDMVLALSPMTLPHELARVVLLEQIYRACTLMRNLPYHK